MEPKLQKKYGLLMAICMVVGIVIGSGVFFKTKDVLHLTNGSVPLGILAWAIGGVVMLICALNFANLASKYEKVNGLVDYSEATLGGGYAYFMSWFLTTIYYPANAGVLAWVCGMYTLDLFGMENSAASGMTMAFAGFYLVAIYALNVLSPKLSEKFQISTTIIKLIPICLIAIVGTIVGLVNGNTPDSFASSTVVGGDTPDLMGAVIACAFAYEGWIIATSINAEIKNSKKTLPLALIFGCIIIAAIYILYFVGCSSAVPVGELMENGTAVVFRKLFGNVGATIINALVVVSCFGTLNGLMVASTRGMYAVSCRGQGPKPPMFGELSAHTNMPANSSALGLMLCGFWMFFFFGSEIYGDFFGVFSFDSSALPIVTLYAMYIPMFIMCIKKHHKGGIWKNIVLPILAIIACLFMVFAAVYSHKMAVVYYLILYGVVMGLGALFYKRKRQEMPLQ